MPVAPQYPSTGDVNVGQTKQKNMTRHKFGGPWTEIKLEVLKKYLRFYTQALGKRFELLYIDAFAGTGNRTENIPAAPIMSEEEHSITYDGSARIALKIVPPFNKYLFIENNTKRFKELSKLKKEFSNHYIEITKGDANEIIKNMAKKKIWNTDKYRGVIFLDPYGLEIDWHTLEAIADTKSFDVWFLFSISGVYRQASLDFDKMEQYKKEKLTRLFGTDDWEDTFYGTSKQKTLFGDATVKERKVDVRQMEDWVLNRLKGCFPYVSKPLALPSSGTQLYSLFFCVSNSSRKAIELAKKVADHILQQQIVAG